MEAYSQINQFLIRVQKNCSRIRFILRTYLFFTGLLGTFFCVALFYYLQPSAISYFASAFLFLIIGKYIHSTARSCSFKKINREGAALLTEKKYPELNNSLINSVQLGELISSPDKERFFSSAFIEELLTRTQDLLTKLNADSVIKKSSKIHSRNLFLNTLALCLVTTLIAPDFWQQALKNSRTSINSSQIMTEEKNISNLKLKKPVYSIHDLALNLNYPAYTRLPAKAINPSDGSVKALPGTEVLIKGKINQPVQTASLVVNEKDSFLMESKKDSSLSGSFMVREKGFYQFKVKGNSATRTVLPQKFSIELEKDQKPRILLFPSNPKPVYFDTDKVQIFYEGSDDFGIRKIELVAQIDDKIIRKNIKNLKNGEKTSQGRFTWNLAMESFKPGQEIQYYLEIKDNDNVTGPNKNQSEIIRFTIYDSRKEQENLVRLQDELTEKMIALLATGIVEDNILKTTKQDALYGKKLLASNADALIDIIGLAKHIKNQAKELSNFPQAYLTLLNNIILGLKAIRQDKIEEIDKIQGTRMKPTPVDYSLFSIEMLNDRMVTHLERDILYLIKITNRQKMDRVMDLENQLSELTEDLKEEFKNLKNKKSPLNSNQLKSKLNQIQQTLKQIMEKLAQQNQSMPDEFLNSKSYKSMNMEEMMDSIEKIQDLTNQGKMDEAAEQLKKMAKELRKFAEQLNQAESSMEEMVDAEMMEQLNESTLELKKMERTQREIIKKTSKINQELRKKQSEKFESLVKKIFEELKKDVKSIRSILNDDKKYLNQHLTMKKLRKLIEKETSLKHEIQSLGQETIDSSLKDSLAKNFAELRDRQRQLSSISSEMNSLKAMVLEEFKEKLPELQKKYDALKELAELNELNEFNLLFKNTYPEILRWQGNMQASRNEDVGGKIRDDLKKVTRLNAEISKKLGSLKRSIETSNNSLLSKEAKAKLNKMAQQEKTLQEKTKRMQQQFSEMNQKNPMLPPSIAQNMKMAGKNLKRAESRLQRNQVQKGVESENNALKQIQEAENMLSEMKKSGSQMFQQGKQQNQLQLGSGGRRDSRRGGAVRMQKEKVLLPSDDQYKVPSEFREDILDAMKKQTPKNYEQLVNEYYRELVQ